VEENAAFLGARCEALERLIGAEYSHLGFAASVEEAALGAAR